MRGNGVVEWWGNAGMLGVMRAWNVMGRKCFVFRVG